MDAQHLDAVYILRQLMLQKAFHFTAMPTLVSAYLVSAQSLEWDPLLHIIFQLSSGSWQQVSFPLANMLPPQRWERDEETEELFSPDAEKTLIHNMHIVYLFYSYSYLQTYTPLSPLSASPFFLHLPPASSPSGRRGRWRSLRCVRSSWSERPDLRSWSTSSCWMWAETQ